MNLFTRAVVTYAAVCCLHTVVYAQSAGEPQTAVLVQGSNLDAVVAAVCAVGGEITHELGIINAVGARLTLAQVRTLEANDDTLRIRADRMAEIDSRQPVETQAETAAGGPATQGPCAPNDADTGNDETQSTDTRSGQAHKRATGDKAVAP